MEISVTFQNDPRIQRIVGNQFVQFDFGRMIGLDEFERFGLPPTEAEVPMDRDTLLREWHGFLVDIRRSGDEWSAWIWRRETGWDRIVQSRSRQSAVDAIRKAIAVAWA